MLLRTLGMKLLPFFLLITLFIAVPASAHQNSLASTKIDFENKRMVVSMLIDQKSILEINGYDITKVYTLDESMLTDQVRNKTYSYIGQGFLAKNNGTEMTPAFEGMTIPDPSNVQVNFAYTSDKLIDQVDIDYNLFFEYSDGKHKNLATIENGDQASEFIFANDSRHLALNAGLEVPLWTAIQQFVLLGIEHILTGYDHLMFLFALILLGGSFRNIVKIVTSFTVAHSITLILASMEIVSLPGAFVESMIALSILYVAIENQFIQDATYRWLLTFAFGLIHGFGFAGALAETQVPKNHFITSLLTFNVGVEIGQLLVVIVLLPIIMYLKRFTWNIWFVRITSLLIGVFGLNWFLLRAFDIEWLPFLSL